MPVTAGLDVGGAHLKVALIDDGRVGDVRQIACPLWQGLDKLDAALAAAAPDVASASRVGVTMTGELSDLFPDRETGVRTLVGRLDRDFGKRARYWMGPLGFGTADDALRNHASVGSTNFLASASLVGQHEADAILIDFGSTTADIIPVLGGTPRPRGLNDAERQTTGELVYTGFTRTAVMGVTSDAMFRGERVGLAREYLATMADVRRILGVELSDVDLHATADGKGKSRDESITRLARMFGRDRADGTADDWLQAAAFIRELQLRSIHDDLMRVVAAMSVPVAAPVVAAGIGAEDVLEIARRAGHKAVSFGTLVGAEGSIASWATACAPAVAVGLLTARTQA